MCALNRPLDDQNQMRIRLEADAVALILGHARAHTVSLVVSPVHLVEVEANPDTTKREHILLVLREVGVELTLDRIRARRRAEELHERGIGPADAAHVAWAELAGCDFVTVDDRLLRRLGHIRLGIWFGTPTGYCDKENLR
jgi:predicted nucleic acid-binding protein